MSIDPRIRLNQFITQFENLQVEVEQLEQSIKTAKLQSRGTKEGIVWLGKEAAGIPKQLTRLFTGLTPDVPNELENRAILIDNRFNAIISQLREYLSTISIHTKNLTPSGNSQKLLQKISSVLKRAKTLPTRLKHLQTTLLHIHDLPLIANIDIPSKLQAPPQRKAVADFVDEILEARRAVNLYSEQRYNFKLLKENETAMLELGKSCSSEDEFNTRILHLSSLINDINVTQISQHIRSPTEAGSINVLQAFLEEKYPGYDPTIIQNLRNIVVLRSKRTPVHRDDKKLIQTLEKMNLTFPPDWSELWKKAKQLYLESIQKLKLLLEESVLS